MTTSTIAAIATPQAAGGIGIIRISGSEALSIADRIFLPISGNDIKKSKGYRAYFGKACDRGEQLDEAVCLVFRAPHSYTGEDVVEISCHGGLYITKRILEAAISAGAKPAEAGEFTKRAFLNGKIDLSEAEAVMGMISAQGEQAAKAALTALEGALSNEISQTAREVISVSANIAAWVDYPDEDIEEMEISSMREIFTGAKNKLLKLLNKFDAGQAIISGVDTAIAGRPNVGKSTLMNLLAGCEKSIVTSIAGTTRDIVEETVRVGDVTLRLSDTAGIRETDNPVESIGVERARTKLQRAVLILAVFDGSQEMTSEDEELLNLCRDRLSIAVINKGDKGRIIDEEKIKAVVSRTVNVCAADGSGYDELCKTVSELLGTDSFDPSSAMISTVRQKECCQRAVRCLDEAIDAIDCSMTLDAVNVCADSCIEALLELTGEKASEAVVNEVFSKFCVGK
ncbi:MAG: tRNA uridine-5-carboxymethylaminomethyl(34) synthesis GTPase MnmE [Clostridia bacterium]|nr:tRNA uridine-5-carboxymethylaminomethyl(34) synthesis GTPase MnmE [Clostridia bacterium]